MAKRNFFGVVKGQSPTRKNTPTPPKTGELPKELQPKSSNSILVYKTFRHNEADQLCDWVNDNKIKLQTIAADGNRMLAFYWKKKEPVKSKEQ
uniref:hypothetical protein n=1 Tax=uncultured Draconibacterium sp. TaxID=1573823 RepID=UPI003217BDA1